MKTHQMNIKHLMQQALVVLLFGILPVNVHAIPFTETPATLDLILAPGEITIEQISLTIDPFLIRAYEVDVVSSDPAALMVNLSGIQINGGGGATSIFDISFTGDIAPQQFDLNFVDSEFGGILGTIPVSISAVPIPAALPLFISGLLLIGGRALRKQNASNIT